MTTNAHTTFPEYPEPIKRRCDAILDEEIAKALWETKGLQATAALRLGCSPSLLADRIKTSPYLQAVRADAREVRIDRAELGLDFKIEEKDVKAIMFFLTTIGKSRGYVQEVQTPATKTDVEQALAKIKNTSKELVDDKSSSG